MNGDSGHRIYRRLLGIVKRYRVVFALAVLAVGADAGGQALFIYLLQPLIDDTIVPRNGGAVGLVAAMVMVAVGLRVVGNFGGVFGMEWVGRHLIADLRRALFSKYLVMPTAFFEQTSGGQLISRLTYNTEQVAEAVTKALIGAVRDFLTVAGLITVMLIQSWRLTLAMGLLLPVVALVVTVISRRFRQISTRIQNSMGDVTHVTEEAVTGQHVIKVFGGQEQEGRGFEKVNDNNRGLHMKLVATQLTSSSLIQIAAGLALVTILLIATSPGMRETITAGAFMSVLSAMAATIPPLKRLTTVHAAIQKGIAAAESVFHILDAEAEPDRGERTIAGRARGELVFDHVDFRYPGAGVAAVEDVSFKAAPGTVTALVGRSGSGKSTLVKLLPRFYSPSAGRITLDGHDLEEYRLADLRRQIALVSQDVVLFNDTVARNIAYGLKSGTERASIEAAAETAHAMEFVRELPDGLDTRIGPGGVHLSGGQRQRLAIARALLKDAPVLILDEATSALDPESETKVRDALAMLMANRTTLVIAHRLMTVERADQVVVLDHGRVIECGSHDDLLLADGLYSHLYRLQFAESGA